jgi:hypothetical protein
MSCRAGGRLAGQRRLPVRELRCQRGGFVSAFCALGATCYLRPALCRHSLSVSVVRYFGNAALPTRKIKEKGGANYLNDHRFVVVFD